MGAAYRAETPTQQQCTQPHAGLGAGSSGGEAHAVNNLSRPPHRPRQLCGKEFNRMHNLMGHMHLHSDSKPFKCLYCPSKFTLKGNLTRHMKVKHGVMERGLHSQGKHSSGRCPAH